ncbi:hypothetical protein [Microbacterium sp. NC79]|uniref:hypothetical protein n=1 Tax=Microbacterium sp. NC79 TaxID=2851009 RepID=UPI001C2C3B1D|nr:hypothetical protein [Microbacterium sp. NC79]MBV0895156.1 hypothetical protein [Microbacterium sp. NC79]
MFLQRRDSGSACRFKLAPITPPRLQNATDHVVGEAPVAHEQGISTSPMHFGGSIVWLRFVMRRGYPLAPVNATVWIDA